MAVQGFGAGDFVALSKFAWNIYNNVRESRTNFVKLNIDVECLLVSIGSLDKGHTRELIDNYIDEDDSETRQVEVRALRDGLNSVIMPFFALFDTNTRPFKSSSGTKSLRPINRDGVTMYVDGPSTTDASQPSKSRPWRRWAATNWFERLLIAFELKDMDELRSRFGVQAANLNLFMTRLTHTQLQRQTELITLNLAEQSLLRDNFRYSLDLSEATRDFRQDVASYIRFLLDGGKAFSTSELSLRKTESRNGTTHRRRLEDESRLLRERERERTERVEERKPSRAGGRMTYSFDGGAYTRSSSNDEITVVEVALDDNACLKLTAARERLALASLSDDPDPARSPSLEPLTIADTAHPRPSLGKLRSMSEQILVPSSAGVRRSQHRFSMSVTSLECDVCNRSIQSDKAFYRCESGRCGGEGDSYDVCRRCYMDGENCPGFERGVCLEMVKVMKSED